MDHKAIVYELLEVWGDKPRTEIKASDRLVKDIHLDGDDFAMSFLPTLQRRLGFEVSPERWSSVVSVGDILRIVEDGIPRLAEVIS